MNFGTIFKKKLLFVISSLAGGGAERVLVHLINHLDRSKYDILLVIFENKLDYKDDLELPVKIVCLGKTNRWHFFKIILKLRRLIYNNEPDVVISSLNYTNIVTGFASILLRRNFRLIFWEHNYPRDYLPKTRYRYLRRWLMRLTYKKADRFITVSNQIKKVLEEDFDIQEEKIKTIYNPILLEKIRGKAREKINHRFIKDENVKVIISVGRLTVQKRYDRLLKAFSSLRKTQKNCRLIIVGKGDLSEELKILAYKLKINEYVDFVGFRSNPYAWIAKADIFVLSSDYEGFPIVLLEAMACGTPIVSTNCSSGPNEMITNGINGILVPVEAETALAEAILILLREERLRRKFSIEGKRKVEKFRIEKILSQYEELF